MSEAAVDSASDFAASSDEEGSQQGWTPRQAFVICDAFPTFEEAIIGIDVLDGCHYKYKHNYGTAGNGTRIYSCKSQADCPKRLRLICVGGDCRACCRKSRCPSSRYTPFVKARG
ncbi:hypothetical protein GQ600_20237 [Phytophthora cactorum]|nr:hypothetical protein GQ600_20237 [Phytophthora cactorum]